MPAFDAAEFAWICPAAGSFVTKVSTVLRVCVAEVTAVYEAVVVKQRGTWKKFGEDIARKFQHPAAIRAQQEHVRSLIRYLDSDVLPGKRHRGYVSDTTNAVMQYALSFGTGEHV